MTTLVTGGTGFLGRHVVRRLLDEGQQVRVLSRRYDLELADWGAEIFEGDLSVPEDVRRAIEGVEVVYHLAGRVERDPERAHLMYDLHVDGTRRLLDALRGQPVQKIVVASTSGTVGVSEDPNTIADDHSPSVERLVRRWPYYLSKIYAERVCLRYVEEYDMPVVLMRPTLLLGPGDVNNSSTGDVALFLQRKIPTTPSGGLSFVDVRDVADAFLAAAEKGRPGQAYLLGAVNLTVAKFFRRLEHLSGVPAPKLPMPDGLARFGARLVDRAMRAVGQKAEVDPVSVEMGQHYWYIDWQKATDELGFAPRNPNETLRDTIAWLREHHPSLREPTRGGPVLGAEAPVAVEEDAVIPAWLAALQEERP